MSEQNMNDPTQLLKKKLEREKNARLEAEDILENKSRELYLANIYLTERYEISRLLTETDLVEQAIPTVLKIICKALQMQVASFWKVDSTNNLLRNISNWHDENSENTNVFVAESNKLTFKQGQGLPGMVWENKSACFIRDVVLDDKFMRIKIAERANLHSAFAIPLFYENEIMGVLEFFTTDIYSNDESKSKFLADIGRQIGTLIAREKMEDKIRTLSRYAGMAETASSVLHNIGNILNSVKTSLSLIESTMSRKNIDRYVNATALMNEHSTDIATYLSQDDKGKILPSYLIELAKHLKDDQEKIMHESKQLSNFITHIEDIVRSQQFVSGIMGVVEKISIIELIDTAINMSTGSNTTKKIELEKNYKDDFIFISDKSKILQILVNLIQNAKDALNDSTSESHNKISFTIQKEQRADKEFVQIIIQDNGMGILKENLTRIFSFGFTTKQKGHGFGLHNSSLNAKELGGSLVAVSDGPGSGAKFILTLPMNRFDNQDKFVRAK